MSDTPKDQLHAWCVTLIHGPAAPVVNVIIAPSSVAATALVMRQAYVEIGVPKEDLTGVGVNEITLDWLRRAVHALETGQTSGQVLSLVPQQAKEEICPECRGSWPAGGYAVHNPGCPRLYLGGVPPIV